MKAGKSDATAVEVIVETLKQSIQKGALKPGDKLPTLREMESMYCVSRIVLREAIKVLEGRGLLYSRQGSGIYVAENMFPEELKEAEGTEYTFSEMFSMFEFIYHYAIFALKNEPDLSEIEELKKLNQSMTENYFQLTHHQKFVYESTFGVRLVRLSKNRLAYRLYLMLNNPWSSMDYSITSDDSDYIEILKIDQMLINAILERDPYRACLWGHERISRAYAALKGNEEFLSRTYKIFINIDTLSLQGHTEGKIH